MADKPKRKGINGKDKGKEYELKTSKTLGKWWSEDFHRTPASGGLKWQKDNRVAGDIVPPPDSKFPFSVECKKHEDWCLEQVLKGVGEIESWWGQCSNDSVRVGKKPMLIFSKNFDADYVMILLDDFLPLVSNKTITINWMTVAIPGKPARVLALLPEFLSLFSKEHILESYSL